MVDAIISAIMGPLAPVFAILGGIVAVIGAKQPFVQMAARQSVTVAATDVYDAFTTIRPYRSQSRPKEVLKMLQRHFRIVKNTASRSLFLF